MFQKKYFKKILLLVLTAIPFTPAGAYASWGNWNRPQHYEPRHHHYYPRHNYPHAGLHVSFLPHGSITISLGKSRYYYCDGVYYSRGHRDFVVVTPPVGVVIRTLPS